MRNTRAPLVVLSALLVVGFVGDAGATSRPAPAAASRGWGQSETVASTVTPSWAAAGTVASGDIDPDSVRISGGTATWRALQDGTWTVQAARMNPDRSWGAPVTLSAPGAATEAPTTNDPGEFVAWRELDGGHWLIKLRRFDGEAWLPAQTLSTEGTDAAEPATYFFQYSDREGTFNFRFVLFREQEAGNWLVKIRPLSDSGALPAAETISTVGRDTRELSVTEHGAIWSEFDGANWRARSLPIYDGEWTISDLRTVSPTGEDVAQPELATFTMAVWRSFDGTHWRARAAEKNLSTWAWKTPVTVSPANVDVEGVTATYGSRYFDDLGSLLVAWRQYDGATWRVAVAERRQGSWLASKFLTADTADTADASIPRAFSGFTHYGYSTRVHWTEHDGSHRRATAATFLDAEAPTTQYLSSPDIDVAAVSASGDGFGASGDGLAESEGGFAAWVEGAAPDRAIKLRGFDTEPPFSRVTSPRHGRLQAGPSMTVRWRADDDWSSITSHDVRWRTIPWWWSTTHPAPESWLTRTHATSRPVVLRRGRTHCFSSRARDATGKLSAWSGEKCAIRPADDRVIPAGPAWRRRGGEGYVADTYLEATRQGAVLRMGGLRRVCSLAILVATGPRQGRIRLTFDTNFDHFDTTKIIDLRTPTYLKQQIRRLVTFDGGQCLPGTLSVRVLSEGKPVRIDGVFIGKR